MYLLVLGLGLLISASILTHYLRSPAFSLFHPFTIYSAFHFLVFVIRPILGFWLQYDRLYMVYMFAPTQADKIAVILAANLGYLSFALFCLRAGSMPFRFGVDATSVVERRELARIFVWVALLLTPVAAYSLSRNFVAFGGNFDGQMLDRSTGITINTKSNGYFTDAQLMLAPICAIIAWLGRFRLLAMVPIIAFVAVRGGSGGRGPFVAALVMVILLYLYEKRRRYPSIGLTALFLTFAAFFSWVGVDRGVSLRAMVGITDPVKVTRIDTRKLKFMESMDLANMEFFEYIVWVVPQRSGTYDYFLNNLQIFTEPVPRVLWKSKPIGAPIQPVRLFDYGYPIGMTYSLPGAGWYALGWAGVFLWCGLWGHITGTIYRRYCLSDHSTMKTAAYMIFVASLVITFRDGMLVTMVKQVGVYLAPIMAWFLLARFLGLPTLAQLRQRAARHLGSGPARVSTEASLPPAVARRRAALAATRASTSG